MEEIKTNSGQNLGIAALITGIITFVLAVIPCVGMIAIIPGIIAIVLASVGLSQASRNDSPKGILIAGLIIGIVAVMISFSQFFVLGKIAKHKNKWPTDIQTVIDDVKNNVEKDLNDANVSIKIESNGQKVEINANSNKKDLEKKLEDLESGNKQKNDTIKKAK
jgi:phosphate/sulfate permease